MLFRSVATASATSNVLRWKYCRLCCACSAVRATTCARRAVRNKRFFLPCPGRMRSFLLFHTGSSCSRCRKRYERPRGTSGGIGQDARMAYVINLRFSVAAAFDLLLSAVVLTHQVLP